MRQACILLASCLIWVAPVIAQSPTPTIPTAPSGDAEEVDDEAAPTEDVISASEAVAPPNTGSAASVVIDGTEYTMSPEGKLVPIEGS